MFLQGRAQQGLLDGRQELIHAESLRQIVAGPGARRGQERLELGALDERHDRLLRSAEATISTAYALLAALTIDASGSSPVARASTMTSLPRSA
jgi:hypothetical protein